MVVVTTVVELTAGWITVEVVIFGTRLELLFDANVDQTTRTATNRTAVKA